MPLRRKIPESKEGTLTLSSGGLKANKMTGLAPSSKRLDTNGLDYSRRTHSILKTNNFSRVHQLAAEDGVDGKLFNIDNILGLANYEKA